MICQPIERFGMASKTVGKGSTLWEYAPVWAVLFSAGTAVIRKAGNNYILKRDPEWSWSDLGTALTGAAVGYALFRMRHGNKKEGLLKR